MISFKPAVPYTRSAATAKARELHPGAFCKEAKDSARAHRCQVLVTDDGVDYLPGQPKWENGKTYLCASGPDWVTALSRFHDFMEENSNAKEAEG